MKRPSPSTTHELGKLREASWELKGIAYLLRNQRQDEVLPLDLEEISCGIGMVVGKLGDRIGRIGRRLEAIDLEARRNE